MPQAETKCFSPATNGPLSPRSKKFLVKDMGYGISVSEVTVEKVTRAVTIIQTSPDSYETVLNESVFDTEMAAWQEALFKMQGKMFKVTDQMKTILSEIERIKKRDLPALAAKQG